MVRTPAEVTGLFSVLGMTDALDDPRFATPEARLDNGAELIARMRIAIATRDSSVWLAAFQAAAVPAALVGTLDDLPSDAQLRANRMTVAASAAVGSGPLINHPVNVDGLARRSVQRAPDLGQHSDEILRALDIDDTQIAQLRHDGVI
jgi:formyl-CoA transferase